MKQFVLTCSMGKRLIGKAMVQHPAVAAALTDATLVIVAGTTNGYVAEEILSATGQGDDFTRKGFRRGMVAPPDFDPACVQADFAGDVVLAKGRWLKGKTIFDVSDALGAGDVILKGANAVDLTARTAAVLVGDPALGTSGVALRAVVGRRVRLIVPVGVEKRVFEPLGELVAAANSPQAQGPRMLPLPGEVFTELDALALLTGATARLLAAGGVCGAEGAAWIGVDGTAGQIDAAAELIGQVAAEPPCQP